MSSKIGKSILTRWEIEILNSVADAMVPRTELLPQAPSELNIADKIQNALAYSHPQVRFPFRLALWWIQFLAIFYRLGGRPFTRMKPEKRERFLFWWQHRRFIPMRLSFRLIQVYVYSHYYSFEEVYRRLGFSTRLPEKTPSRDLYGPGLVLEPPEDVEEEVEICIIGSGAGGAVMAKELAERGHQVVLLEEGGRFDLNDFKEEAIFRSQKMYRDAGIFTTIGYPPILIPLGKTIGGTTVINSGTCFRTPEEVLKVWREKFGLIYFTNETLGPYYEKVEKIINVMPVPEELMGASGRVIARGMERLGISGAPLSRNIKGCQGSGLCCFGCPTDGKQSVQLNYIPQAMRAGARLFAHCRVIRLKAKDGRVTLIEAESTRNPKRKFRFFPKTVIVAAGSMGTPLLLLSNKLGNQSGELGKNLTLHPAAKAFALFEERLEGWKGTPQSYYSDFLKAEGITFEGVFTPPSITSTGLLLEPRRHKEVMEQFAHLAAFGFMTQESARGRVRRLPNGQPLITYSMTNQDLKRMIKGLTWLTRIFFAGGAKAVFPSVHGLSEIHSDADLDEFYRRRLTRMDLDIAAFHPLGTARMGVDPKRSVVDEYGRVHDMKNLFICDGSVLPTNLGVNPQVTIMAFATRAAEHLSSRT